MGQQHEAELVSRIYEAALQPDLWDETLECLRKCLDTVIVSTLINDDGECSKPASLHALSGAPASAFSDYASYYYSRDVRWRYVRQLAPGKVYVDIPQISREEFYRSEIFCDYVRRYGMDRPMGVMLGRTGSRVTSFTTYQQLGRDFTARQVNLLQRIAPHISRAMDIEASLSEARTRAESGMLALDHMPAAIFIASRDAVIHDINQAGQTLLDSHKHALRLSTARRLEVLVPGMQERLLLAIDQALSLNDGASPPPILVLRGAEHNLSVLVTPARGGLGGVWHLDPRVLIMMRMPGAVPSLDATKIAVELGLTPAEAAVVCGLAAGRDAKDIAAARTLALGTVYLHVKRALSKTGQKSQAQLVRLALTSIGALVPNSSHGRIDRRRWPLR